MGFLKGRNFRIKLDDGKILHAETCTISINVDFETTVTKDTGNNGKWKESEPTSVDYTLNHSGLVYIGNSPIGTAITAINQGTKLSWDMESDGDTGSDKLSGTCYFSGMNLDAPASGNVKIELPLQGTGIITHSLIQ